jgi:dimethylargininase
LLPIPGHPSRIAEQPPIADFLSEHYGSDKFQRMESGCKMDGGDILRLGDLFFVGRSSRTNDAGIAVLRELVEGLGHELRVIDLPVEALHLTSITSTPTDTIGLEGEKVLVAKGYPTVLSTIEELDLKPIVIDMSQIRAADGSLTCLSIFY